MNSSSFFLPSSSFSPGWPNNKGKCTDLFNYCITYVDSHNSSSVDGLDPATEDPFVVKVAPDNKQKLICFF